MGLILGHGLKKIEKRLHSSNNNRSDLKVNLTGVNCNVSVVKLHEYVRLSKNRRLHLTYPRMCKASLGWAKAPNGSALRSSSPCSLGQC